MSEPEQDTEIMLALLSSLLEPPLPSQTALMNALVNCGGDVEAAAKSLDSPPAPALNNIGKRPAQGRLDGWLSGSSYDLGTRKKRKSDNTSSDEPASKASGNTDAREAESNCSPATKSFIAPHDTSLSDPIPTLPRLPPLTLSNPDLVKKHTPCTMHLRVLPPDLACRLFYTMVEASKG